MSEHWLGLTGHTALITGGASGIGRAVAESLGAAGVNLAIADVNADAAESAAAELAKNHGIEAIGLACNVTKKAEVDATVATIVERFGRLDILINNAGINIPRLLVDPAGKEELTEEVWDLVVNVNMKGQFLCAQAAARAMIADSKGGVIINMASESGSEGSEGQSVYAATKAAAYNLSRSWAKELGKHGVRVIGVAPGIMEATGLRSESYENALAYTRGITVEQLRASYEKVSIPIGRSGKLSEVGDLCAFLASPRGGYIHGTTVNISGGKSRA